MEYQERRPSPALRPFVDRLWLLEGQPDALIPEPVLPDGHVEILVHAGDPFALVGADGSRQTQATTLVAGQLTRAIALAPRGFSRVIGARLRAHGLHALFGLPQRLVTDRVVDLADVDRGLARVIRQDVTGRTAANDLFRALDRALCRALPAATTPSPVACAAEYARDHVGLLRVDDLARHAGISRRQLERQFHHEIGLGPKRFLRVLRFQQVLGALSSATPSPRWTEIALARGFYDQAHFINDFRSFTGQTPTAWHVDEASLTAVFSAIGRSRFDDERDVAFLQDRAAVGG